MANVQGTFYRGETQRSGVTPTSPPNAGDDPVGPLNPPGSGNTTTYKQLGDTTDKSFIGKNGYVPVVVNENQLTLQPLPNADQDGLISGGIVQWTGTDYDFNVSSALARFQGVFPLNSVSNILSLTTPDATNDRIDLFILQILFDGNGIPNGMQADFITGTPAASPIKPQINPATQIELTSVLVTAGSTTPTLTEEVIYDENTEWTGTTSGTGTGVFNSAVDPYQGTVSVETTNIQNAFQVQFNNGAEIDISTYQTFGFQINLKASLGANQNLYVTFLDGALNAVSNFVLINLDKSLTGYQFIGIALNAVNFTSFDVQYIRFSFVRTSGPATFSGYFLDIVKLEGGIEPPVTNNTFLNLTDTPSSYIGQAGKTVAVKADETGLEFVTGGGGGITGSGTTNEIAYFTGATSIGSLTTATYPSLTELSYVKGVTSAIQTQINGKQATIAGALTEGYVATIVGGVPTWAAPSGGISGLTTNIIIKATSATTIGDSKLVDDSNGVYNNSRLTSTFFGYQAGLNDDNTSNGNSFFGYEAGVSNISGSSNSFFGYLSGNANTGSNNSFFGRESGQANTSGSGNTFFGYQAGELNTSGSNNSFFGSRAGQDNTAAGNTFFGADCGLNVTSGADNCLFGLSALASATTSARNCVFGRSAGTSITSGQFNVLIGYNAGRNDNSGAGVTTMNNCVIIGYDARNSANSNSNEVVIGYLGRGNGSNTVTIGNTSITGTFLYGDINIEDAEDVVLGTTTGTKIGTATTQKLAFWNKTPIIQPTTAITGATLVGGGGTTITDTDTFGGYTLQQIAAALINTGILA